MKSIDQYNFSNQKVLIRVDYNVPLDDQFNVTDVTRIVRTKETVGKILNDGGTVILMSHLGRPKGEANDKYSLRHIVPTVSEILGREQSEDHAPDYAAFVHRTDIAAVL